MSQALRTVELHPFSIRAAIRPESVNPESRTAELVFSTGARVLRYGWDGPYYEELSLDKKSVRMDRINNGAPLLNAHNSWSLGDVIGVVEAARLADGQMSGTVRFAKAEDDPEADKCWRKVRDGILRNVSVGYRTYVYEKIEGGDEKIPVYRATDWEPYEVSLVPMGADDGAKVRSEAPTNPCRVSSPGEEGIMAEKVNATETRAPETAAAPAQAAAPPAPPAPPNAEEQERQRADGILHACEAAKLSITFARTLIGEKVPLVEAQRRVLDELAKRGADGEGPPKGPSGAPETSAQPPSASARLETLTAEYVREHKVPYAEAFRAVQLANPDLARQYADSLQEQRRRR